MSNFETEITKKSKEMLFKDGITLLNYTVQTLNNPIISLSLIPYIALYCRSAQEYLGEAILSDSVDSQINDLRNGLKLYSGKYNVGKTATLGVDESQNEYFRNKLRLSYMKKRNVHYNLGVFFDEKGHIIGNTQNIRFFLDLPNIDKKTEKEKCIELGRILGCKLMEIVNKYVDEDVVLEQTGVNIKIGYYDLNTNRKETFFRKTRDKEINLIILHILSSIGFMEYVLGRTIPKDNLWLLRIKYVVLHYAWIGLKKMKQHFEQTDKGGIEEYVAELIEEGKIFFSSKFRNCMMHYNLFDKNGKSTILQEYYDEEIPLYGLVESCFEGKSWNTFFDDLDNYSKQIEDCLNTWFKINRNKIKFI